MFVQIIYFRREAHKINYMNMNKCIACNTEKLHKQGDIDGYKEGKRYQIYVCEDCDTSWSFPHTSGGEVYDLIYKHRADVPGYMRYEIYAGEILSRNNPAKYLSNKEDMYYGLFTAIRNNSFKGASVLDVGCGLGYVTYALNEAGYKAIGLDISNEAIHRAKERYGSNFLCEDFFNLTSDQKTYDVICMLELIEHVENPTMFIKHAMSLLNKNGFLIITTPNKSFYPKGSLWETDAPPVHITWFSEDGVSKIIGRLGLTVSFSSFYWYNLIHGNIYSDLSINCTPRTSIFSERGEPLYLRYQKSRIRIVTEKLCLYILLKTFSNFINKLFQIIKLVLKPRAYTGGKSNIICAIISKAP